MRGWFNEKLVPQWRIWWKLHSMQLGVIATACLTAFLADPGQLLTWIAMLPDPIRKSLPYWVGPLCAAIIFLARFWEQNKTMLTKSAVQTNPVEAATLAIAAVKGLETAAKASPLVETTKTSEAPK